jgi:hypothetical protein
LALNFSPYLKKELRIFIVFELVLEEEKTTTENMGECHVHTHNKQKIIKSSPPPKSSSHKSFYLYTGTS